MPLVMGCSLLDKADHFLVENFGNPKDVITPSAAVSCIWPRDLLNSSEAQ